MGDPNSKCTRVGLLDPSPLRASYISGSQFFLSSPGPHLTQLITRNI